MNYTEKHLEHIDAYVTRPDRNGDPPKLTPDVSGDPMLKEAFHDVEMLWQATRLEKLQGKLDMLKRFEADLQTETPVNKEARTFRMRTSQWVMSAAAAVLILVAVGWLLLKPGPQPQNTYLAANMSTYILHDVTKGEDDTYTREQLTAFNLFVIKEFRQAEKPLAKIWKEEKNSLALYYLIASHIGQGEKEQAIELLNANRAALSSQQQSLLDELLQHE